MKHVEAHKALKAWRIVCAAQGKQILLEGRERWKRSATR